MSKTANKNGSTTRTTNPTRKGSRGPRPIQTIAQLRERLLRDAIAKELKKIDRKIATANRVRSTAQTRITDADAAIANLTKIRAEFLAESGLKA